MSKPSAPNSVARAYRAAVRRLPLPVRRRVLFLRGHRRLPDLAAPQTFNEKLQWRILYDRRSQLIGTCDKLSMKDFALKRAGDLVRVPQTIWHGSDLAELDQVDLPNRWVLKPTHRSQCVFFGEGRPDLAVLRDCTRGWLDEWNWSYLGEWAYRFARREFLVEERIGSQHATPDDYKFYVFDGEPRLVQVDRERFGSHTRRFYSDDWKPFGANTTLPKGTEIPRPAELKKMLAAASALAAGWDFLRVDLYAVDGTVWFGETTPYDGSGLEPWDPPALDYEIGSWWSLPPVFPGSLRN